MNQHQAAGRMSYTVEQVQEVTGWDRNRIYRLIGEGHLSTYKHGRRRFVSAQAIQDCIRQLEKATSQGRPA